MELREHTAWELLALLKKGETSCTEIAQSVIHQIEARKKLNCYTCFFKEQILKQAKNIDHDYKTKTITEQQIPGIPIAIKDNICYKDYPTTCSSKILKNFKPPYNAFVINRILQNKGIITGKTNMDEFAMGSSTETSYFGPTLNPHNLKYIPGGSSGGSAVAVADNQAILALGSDTGGSIRQPAALCGVVGIKPTYGTVSRYGLIAYASSLDQIGGFAKDVKDIAILMNIIAGHDDKDTTSVHRNYPDFLKDLESMPVKTLKIGLPDEYYAEGLNSEIKERIETIVRELEKQGAIVEQTSLPHTEYAVADYYIIAPSEASSNLARFEGIHYGWRSDSKDMISTYFKTRKDGFGDEVKRRILIGTYCLSSGYYDAYYLKALKVRTLIKQDFEKVFTQYDCLITPTYPTTAFKIGEKINDPLQMYLSDIFTISANLAGIPGLLKD